MTHEHDDHPNSTPVPGSRQRLGERLTAFALDELSSDERAEVDQAIATDPAAAREVSRIRQAAAKIDDAMQSEPALALTEAQHARIADTLRELESNQSSNVIVAETHRVLHIRRIAWYCGGGLALAACLAIALIIPMIANDPSSSLDVASEFTEKVEDSPLLPKDFEIAELDFAKEEHSDSSVAVIAADSVMRSAGGEPADDAFAASASEATIPAEQQNNSPMNPARSREDFTADDDILDLRDSENPPTSTPAPHAGGRGGFNSGSGSGGNSGRGFVSGEAESKRPAGEPVPAGLPLNEQSRESDAVPLRFLRSKTLGKSHTQPSPREGQRVERKESLPDSILTVVPITTSVHDMTETLSVGQRPDVSNVYINEMINYFVPDNIPNGDVSEAMLIVQSESAESPWIPDHWLLRVSVQNRGEEPVRAIEQVISFDPERVAAYELLGFAHETVEESDAARSPVDVEGVLEPGETFVALYDVERRQNEKVPDSGGAVTPPATERRGRETGVPPLLKVAIRNIATERDGEDDRKRARTLVDHVADETVHEVSESSRAFRMSVLAAAVGLHLKGDPRVPAELLSDIRAVLVESTNENTPTKKEVELLALVKQVLALDKVGSIDSLSQEEPKADADDKIDDSTASEQDDG